MAIKFEWDERKSRSNEKKHVVGFDDQALLISDPDHSGSEDRFLMLGLSSALRLLVVCHCYREEGDVNQIINARKAVKRERIQYIVKLK